ncbi:hypothetical protein IJ579_05775 [bacterium]|nr:hypothetical protein [bacterium]
MNQIPVVPQCNPCAVPPVYTPAQQPNYNAVKIDINNPTVGVPPVQNPIYTYPQAPVYTYPQAPVFTYPEPVNTAPVYVPAQQPVVQEVPIQQPVDQAPQIPVPQPVIIDEAPKAERTTPVAEEKPAEVQTPEVVEPQDVAPQVDLNGFIAKLADPDFEVQATAMENIANLVKDNPTQATELVDEKVFESLNNILNADSSQLEGPTQEQVAAREKIISGQQVTDEESVLANTITPKEQAERNKSYALFTTAILDKLYADEVEKLSGNTVPLTELPGIIPVVDQLKDNDNPVVRASAIEALSYLQNPAYKNDLNTLFTVAQNDQDAGVAATAKAALEKLAQA